MSFFVILTFSSILYTTAIFNIFALNIVVFSGYYRVVPSKILYYASERSRDSADDVIKCSAIVAR